MMNAKHGELTAAGPVSYEIAKQYIKAALSSALESGVLSVQYRDAKCKRSVTVTNAEEGYAFFGSLFDKAEGKERVYIHSFAKTEQIDNDYTSVPLYVFRGRRYRFKAG